MVGLERRIADQQAGIEVPRHRRQVGTVRHEPRAECGSDAGTAPESAPPTCASWCRARCAESGRSARVVYSATDAIGPRDRCPRRARSDSRVPAGTRSTEPARDRPRPPAAGARTPTAGRSGPAIAAGCAIERPGQRPGIQIADRANAKRHQARSPRSGRRARPARIRPPRCCGGSPRAARGAGPRAPRPRPRRRRCRRRRTSAPPARASDRSAASPPESSGCSAPPAARSPPSSHRRSRWSAGTSTSVIGSGLSA